MKKLPHIIFLTLISVSASGVETTCDNIDGHWQEDKLVISDDRSNATYSFNDDETYIPCLNGEGAILCQKDDITVVILDNGVSSVLVQQDDKLIGNVKFRCLIKD